MLSVIDLKTGWLKRFTSSEIVIREVSGPIGSRYVTFTGNSPDEAEQPWCLDAPCKVEIISSEGTTWQS